MAKLKDVAEMAWRAGRFAGANEVIRQTKLSDEDRKQAFERWWAGAGVVEREGGYSGAAMHLEEIHRLHRMIHKLRTECVSDMSDKEIDELAGVEPQCASCHGYGPNSGQEGIPVTLDALDTTHVESLTAILPSLTQTLARLGVKLTEVKG